MTGAPASLLPAALKGVADAIGEESTFELVRALGGTIIYVAANPGDDSLIVKAIGRVAAAKLGQKYGGEHLDLPIASKAVTLWLGAKGLNNNEIARMQRCTAKTVWRRLNGVVSPTFQLDLFDE